MKYLREGYPTPETMREALTEAVQARDRLITQAQDSADIGHAAAADVLRFSADALSVVTRIYALEIDSAELFRPNCSECKNRGKDYMCKECTGYPDGKHESMFEQKEDK